ncbi:SusC/RagA family TonB-linked outer membrane protein [Sphingobacterium lumbrici]|uniref:SusC/RagA family TonB-linked outer membrane protein n=1 Tax=Sphingobacterium lumbrici TaxID=2559600 RepID=UPI0015E2CF1D|nr:SusC/RagA family TonB-linked outer membrane protein [Sphingobacterium lumbrici]
MKFTVLLLTVTFFQLSASTYGQQVTLKKRNVSLVEIFNDIREQTGYDFIYSDRMMEKAHLVDMNLKQVSLQEALRQAFINQPFIFDIEEKTIIVKAKPVITTLNQHRMVSGRVTNEKGDPLEGVTVRTKISKTVATTGKDGVYSIQIKDDTDQLSFTYLGYEAQIAKVPAKASEILNIQLKVLSNEIDDVIVTGTGIDRKRESFTGATATFTGADLKVVGNNNIIASLKALDPSFIVMDNDLDGSNPNRVPDIELRGKTAVNELSLKDAFGTMPNQPLFILDGFETTLQIVIDMDMNMVASVTILKDAASTALYGARAANGVVVIETVQPKPGKMQFDFTNDMRINGPDLTVYNMMNSWEKLEFERLSGKYILDDPIQQLELDSIYYSHLKRIRTGVDTYWLNEPVRSVVSQNLSLSAKGGDPVFRYGVSFNYKMEPGVMKGSNRDTWGGNINLTFRKNKVNINNSTFVRGHASNESHYGSFENYANANPYYAKGTDNPFLDHSRTLGSAFTTAQLNVPNPLYNASLPFKNQGTGMELQNNLNLIYEIMPKLRFNTGFQISKSVSESDVYTSPDNTQFASTPFQQRGRYSNGKNDRFNMNVNALLSYGNLFAGKHQVTANIRGQIAHNESSSESFVAAGFPSGAAPSLRFAYAYLENASPAANRRAHRSVGATGSVNYAYRMRYLFDASYRIDGSTSFGKDNPFSPYWSTGIGWNIHQENFFKGSSVLNRLKLFSNIGVTGNQNMGTILSTSVYNYQTTYNQYGQGVALNTMGNPEVLPQKTMQISSGVDFGLFGDRVTGSFNTYYKKTTDMVVPIDYPTSSGVTNYAENIGSLITNGYELRVSFAPIDKKTERIVWRVNLTGATLNTKYADFGNALETRNEKQQQAKALTRYKDGASPYDIWAARSLGIDPATGREMFLTANNLHTLDYNSANIVVVGSSKPFLEGVITNSFNYKNLSLSVMMRYRTKADVFNSALLSKVENISYQGVANNQDKRALYDRWKAPGDIAQFKSISLTSFTEISTRFIQEENTLSCESISMGYTFANTGWIRAMGLRNMNLTGYTNDIFRLSSVKRERGILYPYARSVSFSLRASF